MSTDTGLTYEFVHGIVADLKDSYDPPLTETQISEITELTIIDLKEQREYIGLVAQNILNSYHPFSEEGT